MDSLLTVDNLQVQFNTKKGINTAVDGISFSVGKGEILGIVGESGCGKSVTSLSILRLLGTNARISQGSVKLEGRELLSLSEDDMCKIRGNEIAMIFQDPMTALNPTLTIGDQLIEPLVIHQGFNKKDARKEAVEVLKKVGISAPEKRLKEYPHQLSGGMRQRVMIAMALACKPQILLADEPTTALDVTIQAQIMDLIKKLRGEYGMSIMIVTHDLGVISDVADRVVVFYSGQIVEEAHTADLFKHPKHPYTKGLLACIPTLQTKAQRLQVIEGNIADPANRPSGCPFHPRCRYATERCRKENPKLYPCGDGHMAACHLMEDNG